MFYVLIFYLPLCLLVAWLARQKERSGGNWFFLSLFFSPLIGLLAVIAVPTRVRPALPVAPPAAAPQLPAAERTKRCPACAETILDDARVCRFCRTEQPVVVVAVPSVPTMGYCPGCRRLRSSNVVACVYCGDRAPVMAAPEG